MLTRLRGSNHLATAHTLSHDYTPEILLDNDPSRLQVRFETCHKGCIGRGGREKDPLGEVRAREGGMGQHGKWGA